MKIRMRTTAARLALSAGLLLGGAVIGCRSDGSGSSERVCPTCDPQAGGETGDFGGTPTLCGAVARRVVVERSQVPALGFDLVEIERRIARPIDAPLYWTAWWWTQEKDGGGDATGYASETRVKASVTVTSFGHMRPDPEFCDGTVCRLNGDEVSQATCADFLDLGVKVEFETLDGAVRGTAVGQAAQWHAGFEAQAGASADKSVISHAYANLYDVTGTLRLAPDPGGSNYRGQLVFQSEFFPDNTIVHLMPEVVFDTPTRTVWYQPLVGFPTSAPPAPVVGAPKDEKSRQLLRGHAR